MHLSFCSVAVKCTALQLINFSIDISVISIACMACVVCVFSTLSGCMKRVRAAASDCLVSFIHHSVGQTTDAR